MNDYGFLTEELKIQTLNSLNNTSEQLKQYDYPSVFIKAVELEKELIKALPIGTIVPLSKSEIKR